MYSNHSARKESHLADGRVDFEPRYPYRLVQKCCKKWERLFAYCNNVLDYGTTSLDFGFKIGLFLTA